MTTSGADVQMVATLLQKTASGTSLKGLFMSIISAIAAIVEQILKPIGIVLPHSGYVVVGVFVLAALLYSIHKTTWTLIKAVVVGVIVAIILSAIGFIR